MRCSKCNLELFKIEKIDKCTQCEHNGAWAEDDGYIWDAKEIKEKKLERTQAQDEGECYMDSCFDNGCYMFICAKCSHKTNLAIIEN